MPWIFNHTIALSFFWKSCPHRKKRAFMKEGGRLKWLVCHQWVNLVHVLCYLLQSEVLGSKTFIRCIVDCGCVTLDGFCFNTRAHNCWWIDPLCCAFHRATGGLIAETITAPPQKWKGIFLFCYVLYVAEITAKHIFAPGCYRWSGYRLMWIVCSY